MIRFEVPGPPQGKGRPRATSIHGNVRLFTPAKTANYEARIAIAAQQARGNQPPLTGPVHLHIKASMPIPESWTKRKREEALAGRSWPLTKPDLDNILKSIGDGCNGVLWVDDKQITSVTMSKSYSTTPAVVVMVLPVPWDAP